MRGLVLTATVSILAGAAAAEGFSIHDFGPMPTREACMARAEQVLRDYIGARGGYDVNTTDWVVYAWDLTPGDQDVAIMCPVLPDGSFYSFMIVYGETDSDKERESTANMLDTDWYN